MVQPSQGTRMTQIQRYELSESSGLGGIIWGGMSSSVAAVSIRLMVMHPVSPTIIGQFALHVFERLKSVYDLEIILCHMKVAKGEVLRVFAVNGAQKH